MEEVPTLGTVHDILFHGSQDPDHPAIEAPGYPLLTYRDLRSHAHSVVRTLNAGGFSRNDRIVIIAEACPEIAVTMVSVLAGFTTIPLNPQNRYDEYVRLFGRLKPKAVIIPGTLDTEARRSAHDRNIPVIDLVRDGTIPGRLSLHPAPGREAPAPEFAAQKDLATVLLTAGTTAEPKLVPLTQEQFCEDIQKMIGTYGYRNTDRHLHIVPYFHVTGFKGTLMRPLFTGATVICTTNFIPPDFYPLLVRFRPTHYVTVPAMHQRILRELKRIPPEELRKTSLRSIRSGSAALPAVTSREFQDLLGLSVTNGYAMSETGIIAVNIPPKEGSVGIPVIDQLAILDEGGKILAPGETGEIVVRGRSVFSGYEDAPEENQAAFLNGWFRTGDMGYLDQEGYLYITGRKKEIINKGGRKISPEEIEAILLTYPGIREAMVYPVPDPELGEEIAAWIVPADEGISETEVRRYLLDRLAHYKVPKSISLVAAVPRNPAGKPLRMATTRKSSRQ